MSRSTGQGLLTLGADKGDTVAVILPNMPEWVALSYYYYHYHYHYYHYYHCRYAFVMLGASEAGLRVTTLNPTYTPSMEHS